MSIAKGVEGVAVNAAVGMGVSVGIGVGVASGVLWPHAARITIRIKPSMDSERFRCTKFLQKLIWPDYTLTVTKCAAVLIRKSK